MLEIQGMATAVDVTDTSVQVSLPKFTQPLIETPQSIDIVPQHIIQDQGATTLRDTLRNVAGISIAAGEGGAQGDNLTIRGFTARNDIFLDGMRDFGSYYRDPFDMQEVAVLQGPSSVTFGRGSTGGVVNQETKVPQTAALFAGTVDLGTDQTKRITADLDRPLPSLGSWHRFPAEPDGARFEVRRTRHCARTAATASLPRWPSDWARRPGSHSAICTKARTTRRTTAFPGCSTVRPRSSAATTTAFEHGNYLKTNVDMGTVKFEHDVNSHITFRNQARYAHYHRDVRITEAQIDATTLDADPLTTPLGQIGVLRNQIAVNSTETFLQDQADVIMKFNTGSLRHTVVAGAEGGRETSSPYRQRFDLTTVPKTNLLHPDTSQPFAGIVPGTGITDTHVTAISVGAYALDTVNLLPKLDLTGGVRVDRFDATVNQSLPVTPDFAVQAGGRHAQLARCAGVQAGGRRKHLLRLRHVVQSFRRDAGAQRGHAERAAGGEPDVRSGHQVGFVREKAVIAGSGVPHRQDQRPGNRECHHGCFVRQPTGERRPDTSQRIHHQPLGNSGQLRLPGRQGHSGRRSSRSRSARNWPTFPGTPSAPGAPSTCPGT